MTTPDPLAVIEEALRQLPIAEVHFDERPALAALALLKREREALEAVCDLAIWMSGSPSFGSEGEAHEGWVKKRHVLDEVLHPLHPRAALDGEQEEK